jgi:hypothetical protein
MLLSVFEEHLVKQGYKIERRVVPVDGSTQVDIYARKGRQKLLAEARWIKQEGDVFEALGRCARNKAAMPGVEQILILEKTAIDEETELLVLDACYRNYIVLRYIDINDRQVFDDPLTTYFFPTFRDMFGKVNKLLEKGTTAPAKKLLLDLMKTIKTIRAPPALVADIKAIIKKLK